MEEPVLPLHILNQIERRWQAVLSRQTAEKHLGSGMRRLADVGRPARKKRRAKPKRLRLNPA
jgi:hypothetical protein